MVCGDLMDDPQTAEKPRLRSAPLHGSQKHDDSAEAVHMRQEAQLRTSPFSTTWRRFGSKFLSSASSLHVHTLLESVYQNLLQ